MKLKELIALLIDLEVEHGDEEVRLYDGPEGGSPITSVERYDDPTGKPYVLIEASR